MKITIQAAGTGFTATFDQKPQVYLGNTPTEALGEAVRNNIDEFPGLEIEMAPKSDEQKALEERRRINTAGCGND